MTDTPPCQTSTALLSAIADDMALVAPRELIRLSTKLLVLVKVDSGVVARLFGCTTKIVFKSLKKTVRQVSSTD